MSRVDRIFLYFFERGYAWFWGLLRAGVYVIAPRGARSRATVLIYHHVYDHLDVYSTGSTDRAQFAWQMKLIRHVFNPVSIETLATIAGSGACPSRAVVVTFDDGYQDNYTQALPVLKEHGIPATIYLAAEALQSGFMWNEAVSTQIQKIQAPMLDLAEFGLGVHPTATVEDREAAIVEVIGAMKLLKPVIQKEVIEYIAEHYGSTESPRQMLTGEQLGSLSQEHNITLGCHTLTHPMLSRIGIRDAEKDIRVSKEIIERIARGPVVHFAYPYGKYGEHFHAEHVNLVSRLGFKTAVTTDWGTVTSTSSRYMLKRFTPWDTSPLRFYLRLCSNFNRE